METKEGTIMDVVNSKLKDDVSGTLEKYINPANLSLSINDKVIYISLIAGNGEPIIIIQKKR